MEGEDLPVDALVDEALATRPELLGLSGQRAAQDLTVDAARGGFIPTLDAVASVGMAARLASPPWRERGLVLQWPLFSGLGTLGQVREAQRTAELLSAQEDTQRLQVRLDVESARLTLETGLAQIERRTTRS